MVARLADAGTQDMDYAVSGNESDSQAPEREGGEALPSPDFYRALIRAYVWAKEHGTWSQAGRAYAKLRAAAG